MGKIANLSVKAYLAQGLTHGTYTAKSALDGITRLLFTFRKLGNFPFMKYFRVSPTMITSPIGTRISGNSALPHCFSACW